MHPFKTQAPDRPLLALVFITLVAVALAGCGGHDPAPQGPPGVLLIIAHPDDETLFNLGRFRERGWQVSIALVTNGENGRVVQGIKPDYDPDRDEDILIERDPGPGTWLTLPPDGPLLREIATHPDLARERREEFLASGGRHGVTRVYVLSDPDRADFEDSWDHGVSNWDQDLLIARLTAAVADSRPDLIITLNPDETWAHPQHFGLARIVREIWRTGGFDPPGGPRPTLYGLREHGWYQESWQPQSGDLWFDRTLYSPVLEMDYEAYWREATSFYLSQSSHPVWFDARVGVGILPGYRGLDMIRRLEPLTEGEGLDQLFAHFPPHAAWASLLPTAPRVVNLAK